MAEPTLPEGTSAGDRRMGDYRSIVSHYESCLDEHGDTHLGVDWPNARDAETRYRVMLEIAAGDIGPVTLLDFGCGAAHFYDFLLTQSRNDLYYSGLDLSPRFAELCRAKHPDVRFMCADLLEEPDAVPTFDYIVMNGVFTEKRSLGWEEMFSYFRRLLDAAYRKATRGLAFNVMSSHVDWERSDLFHLPLDILARFLTTEITRDFVIRNDYGLYEYTTYLYRRG